MYKKVDNIIEASHWIPTEDERYIGNDCVILNKPYLLYENNNDELAFRDEYGKECLLWMSHNGNFVREVIE